MCTYIKYKMPYQKPTFSRNKRYIIDTIALMRPLCRPTRRQQRRKKLRKTRRHMRLGGGGWWKAQQKLSPEIPYDEIKIGDSIGTGVHGTVYSGYYGTTEVALKVIRATDNTEKTKIENEVHILSNLRHPNIVTFYGVSKKIVYPGSSIIEFYLCTEKLDYSLDTILHGTGTDSRRYRISLEQKLQISLEIANGLVYLHAERNNYVHRDLKPGNICVNCIPEMIDDTLTVKNITAVKIIDCGASREVIRKGRNRSMTIGIGSPIYMAPELIKLSDTLSDDGIYNESVDIYSF